MILWGDGVRLWGDEESDWRLKSINNTDRQLMQANHSLMTRVSNVSKTRLT